MRENDGEGILRARAGSKARKLGHPVHRSNLMHTYCLGPYTEINMNPVVTRYLYFLISIYGYNSFMNQCLNQHLRCPGLRFGLLLKSVFHALGEFLRAKGSVEQILVIYDC